MYKIYYNNMHVITERVIIINNNIITSNDIINL